MKTFWKVLAGIAALAAVTPYSVEKDEETGETKVKALIWNASFRRNASDECECECGCEETCGGDACCVGEPDGATEEPTPEVVIEVDLRTEPGEGDPA